MRIYQGLNYDFITDEFDDLFINSCGMISDIDVNTGVRREQGRDDFQLLCIKKGPFYLEIDNEEVVISDDTVIIFHPGERQAYRCCAFEGASYYWVHFSGKKAESLLKQCGLFDKKHFSVIIKEKYKELIEAIVFEITNREVSCQIKITGLFLELISSISRAVLEGDSQRRLHKQILPAIRHIEQNADNGISVLDCANICNMSLSYLCTNSKKRQVRLPWLTKMKS